MYTIEKNYETITIQGELATNEAIKLMEFYKNLGYNKVTSDYEILYLTKESEENIYIKQIKEAEGVISNKVAIIDDLVKEIEKLQKKHKKDMSEWPEFIVLTNAYESVSKNYNSLKDQMNKKYLECINYEKELVMANKTISNLKQKYFNQFHKELDNEQI
jgi:hypothetical protein